jgi:hypothetical protein
MIQLYNKGKLNQKLEFEFIDFNKSFRSNSDWDIDVKYMPHLINDDNRILIFNEDGSNYSRRYNKCQYIYYDRWSNTLIYYGPNIPGISATMNSLVNFSYNRLEYEFKLKLDKMGVRYIKEYETPENREHHADFYLPDYWILFEVDSDMHWMYDNAERDKSYREFYLDKGYAICNAYKQDLGKINSIEDIINMSECKEPIIYRS